MFCSFNPISILIIIKYTLCAAKESYSLPKKEKYSYDIDIERSCKKERETAKE